MKKDAPYIDTPLEEHCSTFGSKLDVKQDEDLIDFIEYELNQEDMKRMFLALEVAPKLRTRFQDYVSIKATLKDFDVQVQKQRLQEAETNWSTLHNKIMLHIESHSETKKCSMKDSVSNSAADPVPNGTIHSK